MLRFLLVSAALCLLLTRARSQLLLRQYRIEKDFFTGFKAGEFSVYDQWGRTLLFRLESIYAFTQSSDLSAYPTRQVIASLTNAWSPWSKRS